MKKSDLLFSLRAFFLEKMHFFFCLKLQMKFISSIFVDKLG